MLHTGQHIFNFFTSLQTSITHTNTLVQVCVYMHVCTNYTCTYVCMRIYVTQMHVCMHMYICDVCMHSCMFVGTYICIHLHIEMCTHTYVCIHNTYMYINSVAKGTVLYHLYTTNTRCMHTCNVCMYAYNVCVHK